MIEGFLGSVLVIGLTTGVVVLIYWSWPFWAGIWQILNGEK